MPSPRIGSLFSGYGGLDMGVVEALGGQVVWHCEIEPGPSTILAHHWPDTPNLGDITRVDWNTVPPVDVLTGGFPCQDLSTAGVRRGLRPGTRSGLWAHMATAINALRPALVIIENVRGILSAEAHSDLERDCWCVGDDREPPLRALGAVLGDLADLGYDTRWTGVRASDVGAPHQRFRVFIAAWDAAGRDALLRWSRQSPAPVGGDDLPAAAADADVAGPQRRHPAERPHQRPTRPCDMGPGVALLPTPAVNDMGAGKTVDEWDEWTDRMRVEHGNGNGHGPSLAIEAARLLPTPTSQAAKHGADGADRGDGPDDANLWTVVSRPEFGQYAAAVARWATVLNRPAPPPTTAGRLSPRFVEWMMGLPAGHVTAVGLSHATQLKALGNGVVPLQAAHALHLLGVA